MNWFRQTIEQHRMAFLTLLAINVFFMVDGTSYVYAHELKQKEREQFLLGFSRTFGIPLEQLRPERKSIQERFEKAYEDQMVPWAASGSRLIEGVYEELVEQFEEAAFLPEQERLHVASPQEFSGSGSSRPSDEEPTAQSPLRPIEAGGKEQARSTSLTEEGTLPLRRLEQKARTMRGTASSLKSAGTPARAPASTPRGVIPKSGVAPELVALAESLENSPGRIFRYVHDEVDYDPKWGAGKTALGTLHEGSGTSWEQSWLLQELLTAAGVDARFEWGEVQISTELLLDIAGVTDPFRAGDLLTTAGMPIILVVEGSQVVHARMSHAWVKAHLDYIPNRGATSGPGDTWIRMDPSLKRFDLTEGVRLDEAVPFVLGDYLESGTEESPRQAYEAELQAHIDAQNLGVTFEQIKPAHSNVEEAFPFVPGTLRGKILTVSGESATLPETFQQQLALEVREAGGAVLLNWTLPWPSAYGRRLELAWPGATSADQATIDLYGGIFQTPPYEVDLKPVLRLDGVDLVTGSDIGSAEDVVLRATLTPPSGPATVVPFELRAGEHAIFAVDFGRTPQQTVDSHAAALAAATEASELEAWELTLAAATYTRSLAGDVEHLSLLRGLRRVQLGNVVLAVQRGGVSTAPDGTPLTFAIAPPAVDLGSMTLGLFPADGEPATPEASVSTLELLGSHASFLEGEALAAALGGTHLTAVTALTRAVREGQSLTRVDAGNVDAALAAVDLGEDAENSIRAGVDGGKIAWIHQSQLLHETWDAAGYVLEDPATGAGGYFVTYERLLTGLDADIIIHSPQNTEVVTQPTDVVATIESEHEITSWTLSTRSANGGEAVVLAAGSGTASAETLAQFDPTMLVNGLHDLVLTARDALGQSASAKISLVVDGQMKIGNFVLPLLDMAVPVVGVPFDVVRIYDSKDRGPNDFGHGWRLHLSEYEVRENISPGLGYRGTSSGGPIPTYCIEPVEPHLVVVRFPDGSLARYLPTIEPSCQVAVPPQVVTLSYVPAAGTRSEIEPIDISGVDLLVVGSFPGPIELWELDTGLPHDPHSYRLTTATGAQIEIDEDQGLQKIIDTNGNVVEVSPDGLLHSRGLGIDFERDASGRITRITDPGGNAMTYEYDAAGDLVKMTDRVGRSWRYTYVDDHFLDTVIDPNGRSVAAYSYDGDNRWTGYCEGEHCIQYTHEIGDGREVVRDAAGNELSYEYDDRGNVISMTNLRGHTTHYEYNEHGDVTRQINPDGGVLEFEYDARRNLVKRIAPHPVGEAAEDFTTTYTRGANNLVTRVDFPTGAALVMSYDAQGNLLRQEDIDGNTLVEFTYGPGGVITSETGTFGTVNFADHNIFGDPLTVTDAFGATTTYTYDTNGNVLTQNDPLFDASFTHDAQGRETAASFSDGPSITSTYGLDDQPLVIESSTGERRERLLTAAGQVRGWKAHGGFQVDYSYDSQGRLSTVSQPSGDLQLTHQQGKVVARTDERGNTETLEYDSMGRVLRRTNGLGHSTERTIDVADRVSSITNARGKSWTVSYELNRSTMTDPLSRQETVEFDANGLPRVLTRANGATREITYLHSDPYADPEEYITSITDVGGRTVTFDYNQYGNLIEFVNNAGETYEMTWDDRLNRLTSITGPESNSRSFSYDDSGRLEEVTFGDGGTLDITYDNRGLMDTRTRPSGTRFDFTYDAAFNLSGWTTSTGESASLTWDTAGLLTSTTDITGTTDYTWDGPDPETIINSDGSVVTYEHDILGRVTSITVTAPGHSQTTSYGYDEVGNLVSVIDPSGAETTMSYDDVDRLVDRTLPNGVTTTWQYNDIDQVIDIVHRDAGGSVLRSVAYERQGLGEPTRITREDGSYQTLQYDAALRLVREDFFDSASTLVETLEYTYDMAGNRRTRVSASGTETYAYDPGNLLTSVSGLGGVETYSHDADGRLTSIDRDGTPWTLEYTGLDQLKTVTAGVATVAAYAYDAVGRRLRTGDAATAGRQVATAPVTDPTRPQTHLVRASDNSVLAAYAFAHEKPLMRDTPTGSVYYLTDAKGSVIAMVDENGQEIADFQYDGFGNLRHAGGSAADLDPQVGGGFRFHGEWLEEATAFYFLRNRYYDPRTGRFLSRDAAEVSEREPSSLNAYVFASSNPHVFSDPTGLFSVTEVNITTAIQNIAASIDVQLKRYAVDKAKQAAADAAIEFLKSVLENQLGPLASVIEKSVRPLNDTDAGEVFEFSVSSMMCRTLFSVPAFETVSNFLYLEVPMEKKKGRAVNNGLSECTRDGVSLPKEMKDKPPNPDYVLAFDPPAEGRRSTILVGDMKRNASNIESTKPQFRTIINHAKNFGYWTVLYITLFHGDQLRVTSNHRRTSPVVQVHFLSLFGGKRRGRR